MSNSITEPVIPDQRSYAAVLSDLNCGPLGEHIRRPSLATRSIRVGASFTSLDLWYVDLDVTADALNCFRQGLSCDELARAEGFHSDLRPSALHCWTGHLTTCACRSARVFPSRYPALVWKERQADA